MSPVVWIDTCLAHLLHSLEVPGRVGLPLPCLPISGTASTRSRFGASDCRRIDPIASYRAGRGDSTLYVRVDDLTKELWQGVTERVNQPEPVYEPLPLILTEPPLRAADRTSWREFLVSRRLGAILVFACLLGLLGIVSANPFASASVSERVSNHLGQPATCAKLGATVSTDSDRTIYRCRVGGETRWAAQCFMVSGRDIRQVSGRRDMRC